MHIGSKRPFLQACCRGRRHDVITAMWQCANVRIAWWQRDVVSHVKMKRLSDAEMRLPTSQADDWQGKAGGYAIQGPASAFIPWIQRVIPQRSWVFPWPETAALLESGWDIL